MAILASTDSEAPILQDGQIFVGQYRIGKELGRGGFGAVYLGEDLRLKRKVAIKVLHPKFAKDKKTLRRFQIEAVASSRMNHPSIVQVYDTGTDEKGALYIAMEFVEGETLQSRLKSVHARNERLDSTKVLQVVLQAARVLSAAHDKGIFHRDLKPHNLMLTPDDDALGGERVKLLDFGIAKLTPTGGSEEEDEGATSTGDQLPGTYCYMAPEQFGTYKGITGLEGRMDVYALGVILYLAHAGRMPLYNSDPTAMMGLALSVDPEPLARISKSVSPGVAELAHQMLAKEAQTRLTMHQVRDRLAHLLGLSGSRPEFVSIRPTGEHQAMLARFDTAQQEEGLANTADALAAGVQRSPDRRGVTPSTAPKIARSGGERSIDLQLASGDLILSTGRGAGQQLTGPDTLARRSTKRMVVLGLLGVVVVGTSGAVAVQRLALRPKQSVAITQSTPLTPVQPAPLVVTALPTQVPTNVTPQTVTPSTPPHISLIPEPKQPKQRGGCVAPTADCISGRASPAQQGLILDALQEADFKFCQGNRLVLTGNPILKVRTSSGVNHNRLDSFLYTARGKLKNSTFAGEVEIKCKGK